MGQSVKKIHTYPVSDCLLRKLVRLIRQLVRVYHFYTEFKINGSVPEKGFGRELLPSIFR